MMEIWRYWGYIHPHTQLKKSEIPHTHTQTQSMQGFPVKTGRVRAIPTGRVYLSSLQVMIITFLLVYKRDSLEFKKLK